MKQLFLFIFFSHLLLADWQMFADRDNTYLYNTLTGEVYIKYAMGGKNYEDVFVKMPKGVSSPINLPSKKNTRTQNNLSPLPLEKSGVSSKKPNQIESKNTNPSNQTQKELENDLKLQSIKKAQEMLLKTLDNEDDL